MTKKQTILFSKVNAQTQRIELRPYKLTDFSRCRESNNLRLPLIGKFDEKIPTPNSKNYVAYKKRIEWHRKHGKMKVHFIFAIFNIKNGEYIGQIDLFTINKQLAWANLGYHIQNQYWGKGYAQEACKLALKVAFNNLGFHRIEAAAEPLNKASIKVARKIGLEYEGKRKKFFPDNGGVDMVVFAANAIDYSNCFD